jgi:hypothetical protein
MNVSLFFSRENGLVGGGLKALDFALEPLNTSSYLNKGLEVPIPISSFYFGQLEFGKFEKSLLLDPNFKGNLSKDPMVFSSRVVFWGRISR